LQIRLPPSTWFWGCLACLLALIAIRFEILLRRTAAVPQPPEAAVSVVPAENHESRNAAFPSVDPPPASESVYLIIADTLNRDDSIYLSLKRHRVSELQLAQLNQALGEVFNTRTDSKPADYYALTVDTSRVIQRFVYTPRRQPERPILVERRNGRLVARRLELPLTAQIRTVEVPIEDNLANAITAAGEEDALTDMLADDIFGAVIDFRIDPRRGDRIGIVFEKLYKDDHFVRYGRILLAQYEGKAISELGVYYEDPEGQKAYYDAGGKSLERMFLRLPLPYRRITSRFNRRRFHPVLKRTIPHLGTDYAASAGTPVQATARGRVVQAGWKGAYGNLIEIRHPNGYRTRYGHLSRILVRKGQQVQQKQLIGRVGATGRATGSHLHYELIKDGRHLNPENVNKGTEGKPLKERYRPAFVVRRDSLLVVLEAGRHSRGSAVATASAPPTDQGE